MFGQDIVRGNVEIRTRLGSLAQNRSYYEQMAVRENLRFRVRFFFNRSKNLVEYRIAEILELAGLTDKADRPIKDFSGSELKRLGVLLC